MKKKIILTILFAASLSLGAVLILGLGKQEEKAPSSTPPALSTSAPITNSSFQVEIIDQGAVLPSLQTSNGMALWKTLPTQHQFWVIDNPQMQETVSRLFMFPVPNVDFKTHQLVFLFQGTKSTGGYGITVKKIEETPTQIRLWILMEQPGKTCSTIQSLTAPFELIRIPVTSKQLKLFPQQKTVECE